MSIDRSCPKCNEYIFEGTDKCPNCATPVFNPEVELTKPAGEVNHRCEYEYQGRRCCNPKGFVARGKTHRFCSGHMGARDEEDAVEVLKDSYTRGKKNRALLDQVVENIDPDDRRKAGESRQAYAKRMAAKAAAGIRRTLRGTADRSV